MDTMVENTVNVTTPLQTGSQPLPEKDFYRYYLAEHENIACRRMHFIGSSIGLLCLSSAIINHKPKHISYGILSGYACAWLGHYFFEKNKPATFKYPLQSFIGDWRMFTDILRGRISIKHKNLDKI